MKHTKGPWQILPEECDKPYIRIRGTVLGRRYKIANVVTPMYEGVLSNEVLETRANAKRIIDCVNACEGMKDPVKEIEDMCQTSIRINSNILKVREYITKMIHSTEHSPVEMTWVTKEALLCMYKMLEGMK